jgi:DNA polymerase-4
LEAFQTAGLALLSTLHPLPKGIRLLGLGLHNLCDGDDAKVVQLGLAI